ncbi:LPS-induced tumor necrosis factor alpha factor [Penicillium chermesinum]|nr:LPS-induced tumor necrosis factor alpha factor [Penicillium chermesinum]
MENRADEGLIPVALETAAPPTHPISPMSTDNRVSTWSAAPTECSNMMPAPLYGQVVHPNDRPVAPEPLKGYPGQLGVDAHQSHYPLHSPSDVKAYPGQPIEFLNGGPQPYVTPFGQPTGYATAVPFALATIRTGASGFAWAGIACFLCCLGCIPYMMDSLKDVDHLCGRCHVKLATWHNSKRIQIFQTQVQPPDPSREMRPPPPPTQ